MKKYNASILKKETAQCNGVFSFSGLSLMSKSIVAVVNFLVIAMLDLREKHDKHCCLSTQ